MKLQKEENEVEENEEKEEQSEMNDNQNHGYFEMNEIYAESSNDVAETEAKSLSCPSKNFDEKNLLIKCHYIVDFLLMMSS